jgi:hypothetical protein
MSSFTNPNTLKHGCFYNIYDNAGNLIADNAKLEGKPWDGLYFSIESSSTERTPLFLKKPIDLVFVEIEQAKFTDVNAHQIMTAIVGIIDDKGYCDNDDFKPILRSVYEPAYLNGNVMGSIQRGEEGHFKFDIAEALQLYGLTIVTVLKSGEEKYDGDLCYFVRSNDEIPPCSGSPIPYDYSLSCLGFFSRTVNFVAYSYEC